MREAFKASSAAFERNDRAEAKALSNEGKRHQAEMERLSKEAATWIYNGACGYNCTANIEADHMSRIPQKTTK